jgi:hypothetical protein
MKRALKILVLSMIIGFASLTAWAQEPPHPGGDPAGTSGAGPVGGGAPVGSGIVMLIACGALYAAKKVSAFRTEKE